ncbi:MAG: PemK family transcriptional regulator [Acidobacteria bacterium]|nr:MAG: PemK family transcriptional regulator [Acidobacteriota bacterium]
MAARINRAEIWQFAFSRPDKRRPVLVLSRNDAIEVLHTVMVAPITSTIRGAPSEVIVGINEGLKRNSAINLDHIQTVDNTDG